MEGPYIIIQPHRVVRPWIRSPWLHGVGPHLALLHEADCILLWETDPCTKFACRVSHVCVMHSLTFSLEHLLDCVSLATGILSDSLICMTKEGVQVTADVLDQFSMHKSAKEEVCRRTHS